MIKRNYSPPYIYIGTKNMKKKKCINDNNDEKNGMNSTQLRVFPVEEKREREKRKS